MSVTSTGGTGGSISRVAGAITSTIAGRRPSQPIYSSSALLLIGTTERYLFFSTGSDMLPNTAPGGGGNGSGTAFNLYGIKDGTSSGTVMFTRALSPKVTSSANDLITNGERPTASPTVAGDIVFFTTTTDSSSASCTDATTKPYAFTYTEPRRTTATATARSTTTRIRSWPRRRGRGTAPFIVDQHLVLGHVVEPGRRRDASRRRPGLQQRRGQGRRADSVVA